jgi:tRNA modification GTPase
VVSCFAEGHSFTGEETAEISCHGGNVMTASILRELVAAGCVMAKPGEFTFRAFMNGRLDLVQAEGVLGLIESQSRQAARVALRQLKGRLSEELHVVEDGLVWILAQLEASIDFSTEGIEVIPSKIVIERAQKVQTTVEKLLASYSQGRLLAEGLTVALVGRPNVGKSSLLNSLVGEDRAIVTAQPGTTRDLVEGKIAFNGVPVTFIDTAGLRDTADEVEKIGIERTKKTLEKSDIVLHVLDVTRPFFADELADLKKISSTGGWDRHSIVFNKLDADPNGALTDICLEELQRNGIDIPQKNTFSLSAKTRTGLKSLEEFVSAKVQSDASESAAVITQARHFELLQKIQSCLVRAVALITKDESAEFIAFELQDAIRAIHELLGKEFHEQVIDRIFKEFCLGK